MARKREPDITQDRLKELVTYVDGELILLDKTYLREAGTSISRMNTNFTHNDVRCRACLDGQDYWFHRLVWIYHNGAIPKGMEIDHIDGNSLNHTIENLRLATHELNQRNTPNAKGYRKTPGGKYHAYLTKNKKQINLGLYDTPEEAREAYLKGKELHHPEALTKH